MNISLYELGLPIAVIDDLYDEKELSDIWKELTFYNKDFFLEEKYSGSAKTLDGKTLLKKNKTVAVDEVFHVKEYSYILNTNRKIFKEVADELATMHPFFSYLKRTSYDGTMISYYEDSDYYKPHTDMGVITIVTWFHKEPKGFSGGDMILGGEIEVECKNNRSIIFPSSLNHEVTPIKMLTDLEDYGRFAMVQFTAVIFWDDNNPMGMGAKQQ